MDDLSTIWRIFDDMSIQDGMPTCQLLARHELAQERLICFGCRGMSIGKRFDKIEGVNRVKFLLQVLMYPGMKSNHQLGGHQRQSCKHVPGRHHRLVT